MAIAEMTQTPSGTGATQETAGSQINVGEAERWASGIGGAALALLGLKRGGLLGLAVAAVGGSLIYRGATGNCQMYRALGINTAEGSKDNGKGVQQGILITKSVVIRKPRAELFRFWRDFSNLPQFMRNIESVDCQGEKSHWVASGPMNMRFEWDAEIINERPDELIAWQSLEKADVRNAGSVHFTDNLGGETFVKVTMQYLPPAGRLGDKFAKLFGENPAEMLEENLQRFKQLMETGMADQVKAGALNEGAVGVSGT